MAATVEEIDGSHTVFIARPVAAATFILQALEALSDMTCRSNP
jgi:hypothetical protein